MKNTSIVNTALALPTPEIEALRQGRMIVAMSNIYIAPGRKFVVSANNNTTNYHNSFDVDSYYHSNFVNSNKHVVLESITQGALIKPQQLSLIKGDEQLEIPLIDSTKVLSNIWASCKLCQSINDKKSLAALSKLTIWTQSALEETLEIKKNIFLVYLRVFQLDKETEIAVKGNNIFIALSQPLTVDNSKPILPDNIFATRKRQLEKLAPPSHPELEKLLDVLSPLAIKNPAAKQFQENIHLFLGWSNQKQQKCFDSDLVWINKIAEVGNSSDGNEFERLTRKSFIKLGFSCSNTNSNANLNPEKLGGAGGLDFYCEYPYPVVGECKATKTEKVPDGVAAQLIKLGYKHLQEDFKSCVKIILAGGELTQHALLTAQNNHMNVITPETLEKLVELQSHYQGCVNLLELKQCLQQEPFGLADDKVNSYINKIQQDIKLRAHLVQLVKYYLQNSNLDSTGVEALHGAYFGSQPPRQLNIQEMHEILIELSSSLTGYLGRTKGADWKSDKFYFLRDLSS